MHVRLYILRHEGRPLTYAEVKARPALWGDLVLGTWGNPEVHAKLLSADWPDHSAPKLNHARVMRVSNGCILAYGFEWRPNPPLRRQAWLCAVDELAGEAALRKIRRPTPADLPLEGAEGVLEDQPAPGVR